MNAEPLRRQQASKHIVRKIGHKKWLIRPFSADLDKIASENTGYFDQMVSLRTD